MISTVFLQARSHLLHHTSHSRYKPFDVLRERCRTLCNKKPTAHCSRPAVTQELCLSSDAPHTNQPNRPPLTVSDCDLVYSCIVSIPSSDPAMPSCQRTLGYGTYEHAESDKFDRKLSVTDAFNNYLNARTEFATEMSKEHSINRYRTTCDRYDMRLILFHNILYYGASRMCLIVHLYVCVSDPNMCLMWK